ncbi:MAG: pilus assembly PilX N-terminal domain-containing protein [Deltaproteobacteria bacterium]|jgi:Tfp pilus assembly protein PilX
MKINLNNEDGYMIVAVLMILSILTVIATAGTNNSITEQRSATNEQIHELSFYAADTGRAYVIEHVDLYHDDNITVGGSIAFPDNDNPTATFSMGSLESFNGDVEYIGSGATPRGSGFEVGKFSSHRYRITTTGFGPRSTKSEIETGFYRIGF